ncbi:MAG: hypothetical protein LBB74_04630 [Chitinispirillales bacterium]|jgi:hypothetical protein|nr:hypothetical protein [Chitinispirillales bacterium]
MALKLKKLICAAVAMLCAGAIGTSAEVQPNALGLRFIGGNLLGGEFNYQRAMWLFGSKRLEIGASLWGGDNDYSIAVSAVPQWHWNISPTAAKGGFNWYAGPGIGVGFHSYTYEVYKTVTIPTDPYWARVFDRNETKSELYLGIGGQIGIEYDFNAVGAPLNLSIDSRPMINLMGHNSMTLGNIINGACLALRYTF